ncbi:MAG TPA: heme-binding protein, partial [Pseudolabrys sp.]|nr:heme-binding protein [Pseudolabrys sp.]
MSALHVITRSVLAALAAGVTFTLASSAWAQKAPCPVDHDKLVQVLKHSVKASGGPDNGGLPVNEWAAVVNRDGIVCAVAYSGNKPTDQWLGSRAIAVEKANTVNAFGLDTYAISTANLWAQSQPGGSLFGAAATNPPVAQDLYSGDPTKFGSGADPLVGKVVGGVVAFGGGVALYQGGKLVGGLGASGNTSCADH